MMLGRVIGALAGRQVARQLGGVRAGPLGTVAGLALPFVLRRFGPLGMIGAAIGGYAVNKFMKRAADEAEAAKVEPPVTG